MICGLHYVISILPTPVQNWISKFRTGHLNTESEECSARPTQRTVPENVAAIHSRIMVDQRISTKKIAEAW
jgi:hypothetical protein